jgi:hypothetical protein
MHIEEYNIVGKKNNNSSKELSNTYLQMVIHTN